MFSLTVLPPSAVVSWPKKDANAAPTAAIALRDVARNCARHNKIAVSNRTVNLIDVTVETTSKNWKGARTNRVFLWAKRILEV